jgi:UDP-glucuronate decarboxylase
MISILNLAKEIIYQTKSKSKIKLLPEVRPDERLPNMDGAKRLNWEPSTSIAEGLKKTIEYYGGIA